MRIVCLLVAAWVVATASGQTVVIEPDAFADGTDISNVSAFVSLSTADATNTPFPAFFVSATDDNLDYAPTGVNVFGHANVPFFNDFRRLRMDFAAPVSHVQIAFAGGDFLTPETGRLEIYNAANQLIGSYNTTPRAAGQAELMSLTRPQGDIDFAVAYTLPTGGSFGRLDALQFTVVPEPAAGVAMLVGLLALRRR